MKKKKFDYIDKDGIQWIMCACGHRVSGRKIGDKIAVCPNCSLIIRAGGKVEIKYEKRFPSPNSGRGGEHNE